MSRSRELKKHINQLHDIRNILNSMKNLAFMETAKLSRFLKVQNRVVNHINTVASDFLAFYPYPELPPGKPEQVCLLIGSERGFCGDFNESLLLQMQADQQVKVIGIGQKLSQNMENTFHSPKIIDGPNVAEDVPETINQLISTIDEIQKKVSSVQLIALYHDYETGNIIQRQLLPPFQLNSRYTNSSTQSPVLNMTPDLFLTELIEHYLFAVLHEIFYTSLMAENHSRLLHMEGAIQHLDDQSAELGSKAQIFRQEEITEEIEVILLTAENLY